MEIPVIYEDEYLLVIDKPAGVVVNRGETVKEETIADWAEKRNQGLAMPAGRQGIRDDGLDKNDFYARAGIVHRLDKETSGLLIIAKTSQAFSQLQSQFKQRTVVKKYKTLVHGILTPEKGEIKASVGRLPWNKERFGILPGGKEAVTLYTVLVTLKTNLGNFSLLEVTPQTGRTHQIRVHLKYLGFPIVSDSLYGGRKTYRNDMKVCPRLFLHAAYLKFKHPENGKWMELRSKLPKELEEVLKNLNQI